MVLVNMPFASFRQPSLALGLLKASVAPTGARVTVLDATLPMAELISPDVYDAIATWRPEDLLGDWIFARATSCPPRASDEEYMARVLCGGAPEHDVPYFGKKPLSGRLRAGLRAAREAVDALLAACLDEVLAATPDVVGFTSMFHQQTASLAVAERVKAAAPGSFVLFGGASCRGETGEELLRRFPFVDGVATGEGEKLLPELVRRRAGGEALDGIPGFLTRDALHTPAGGGEAARAAALPFPAASAPRPSHSIAPPAPVDLDELPVPDHSDYFARLAAGSLSGSFRPRLPFETSRGCWWGERRRCVFCGQASESLSFRRKSAGRALEELAELTRRHPACPLIVTDEILAPGAFRDFFPVLTERFPGLEILYLEVRPGLGKAHLRQLAEAGVRRLEAGVESLSTPVLRLMRKGATALDGIALLKWAAELGVEVVWNLLWGLPGEDPDDYGHMTALIPDLTHLAPPNAVGAIRVDRFSPLFEDPAGFGARDIAPYPAYGYVYGLPEDALRRLAYYFVLGRDRGGRAAQDEPAGAASRPAGAGHGGVSAGDEVAGYTRPLAEAVSRWQQVHAASSLTWQDDGERLFLFEGRPGFDAEEVTVLDGEHRTLYLACDAACTAEHLAGVLAATVGAASAASVEEALEPLVAQRLMVREGRRYLGLAVPAAGRG